jgi:hypothetical protein
LRSAFVAYDAGETPVGRRSSVQFTLQRGLSQPADRRRDFGRYAPTHCDIVVKMDEAQTILVIGGNVVQSVSLTILPLRRDAEGYRSPSTTASSTAPAPSSRTSNCAPTESNSTPSTTAQQ